MHQLIIHAMFHCSLTTNKIPRVSRSVGTLLKLLTKYCLSLSGYTRHLIHLMVLGYPIITTKTTAKYNIMYRVTTLETMWNSRTVCSTPAHVKCYSYHASTSVIDSGRGRNAIVHDPKPKWNAQTQQSRDSVHLVLLNTCMDANMQLTINSFRQLFPDQIFHWLLVKSPTFHWKLSKSLIFPGFPYKWSPCM